MAEAALPISNKYAPLRDHAHIRSPSEDDENFPVVTRPKIGPFTKVVAFLLAGVICCLAVNGAIELLHRVTKFISETPYANLPCYCGDTLEEAQSLGCKYIPMSASWLPPHCQDNFLDKEFNKIGPNPDHSWTYYADDERTAIINVSTISTFAGSRIRFYNEWEWHVMHCIFYWRKLQRAQFSNVILEPRFNTDAHINHCARLILSRDVNDTTMSGVATGNDYISKEDLRSPVAWDNIRTSINAD